MSNWINKDVSCGSAIATTAPNVPDVERNGTVFRCREFHDEFVTFMTDGRPCRSCLHLRNAHGHTPPLCLHVHQFRSLLVITHACDLHATGEVLAAQHIAHHPHQSLYQLSSVAPAGLNITEFRPAAGVAVLFQRGGRRRLTVFGVFDAPGSPKNYIIDAYEISNTVKINCSSPGQALSRR